MIKLHRTGIVALAVLISGCGDGRDTVEPRIVDTCTADSMPGYDCACFDEIANKAEHSNTAAALSKLTNTDSEDTPATDLFSTQADLDQLLALAADADDQCGFGF